MSQIKIYGDIDSASIFFINSTVTPKALGTVVASLKADEDRIVIQRTDKFEDDGVTYRTLFKRFNADRVCNRQNEELVGQLGFTTQGVIDYINEQANLTGSSVGGDGTGTDLSSLTICFELDETNTSITMDNGYSFGVNTIQAVADADGTIHLYSKQGDRALFTTLAHTAVCIDSLAVSGGLNDVVNTLNELFTVGPFSSVVIADPYATMVADVGGISAGGALIGTKAIDPAGNDVGGATSSQYNQAGFKSAEVINQPGEYFTFDIRNEGIIGMGLVLSDVADVNGNATYGDPATFCVGGANSGNYGYQFAHFFHPTPNGPWTNYGANAAVVYGPGWNGSADFRFNSSPEGADWLAGSPVKMKVGLDSNAFIEVAYWDASESVWTLCARSSYAIAEGVDLHLGVKLCDASARLYSLPQAHLLEPAAPTMYFRYIESPDNNFEYPLFATVEEANFFDLNSGGTGTSHTHTYVDDPTTTTWYMPDNGNTMTATAVPSGSDLVFMSNAVTYTEITSQADADLAPDAFTFSDIVQAEATVLNLQLYPAGATFSQTATLSPTTSGLVYNTSTHYLQGTLADVGADTVYTVIVTRANSYGSTVSTFTITATDVAPVSSLTTPWTKAISINGSNEYLKQVANSNSFNIINMGGMNNDVWGANNGKTSTDTDARPWSISQVVYIDNSQPQCYFSQGENAINDRISLSTHETGANSKIEFYWGRSTGTNGANSNGCQFLFDKPSDGWYGYYIDTTGFRPNQAQSTTTALAANFRFKQVDLSTGTVTDITGTWTIVGDGRLNRGLNGDFYIGRESDSTFNSAHSLKVAATLVSTLKRDFLLPDDTEISMQVRDPQQWVIDYRDGTQQRLAYNNTPYAFDTYPERCVALWLMGDGSLDSYSNNLRNDVKTADQNYTMLRLQNMVSNDIETVNITGLT
jgi:hypothetical protein